MDHRSPTTMLVRIAYLAAIMGVGIMAAALVQPLSQDIFQPEMPEAPASAPATFTLDADNSVHTYTNSALTHHAEQTQKGKGIYEASQAGNTSDNRLMKDSLIKYFGLYFIGLATLMFVYSRIKEWYRRGIEDMPGRARSQWADL